MFLERLRNLGTKLCQLIGLNSKVAVESYPNLEVGVLHSNVPFDEERDDFFKRLAWAYEGDAFELYWVALDYLDGLRHKDGVIVEADFPLGFKLLLCPFNSAIILLKSMIVFFML